MTAPDFLPVLSVGAHSSPKRGACFMEMASFLAGEEWSDSPPCTLPLIASVARTINDRVDDATRRQLALLIPRVIGTASDDRALQVRLAIWAARHVLPLVSEQDRAVCEAAIVAAEGRLDGTVSEQECRAAARAAHAAYTYAAAAYAYYATHATHAAYYAAAYAAYTYAAYTYAAARAAATAADPVGFLTGLLDEYDRLTGRTSTTLTADDAALLAELTA